VNQYVHLLPGRPTYVFVNVPVDFCILAEGNNEHGRSVAYNIRRRLLVV